ncbi:MAG: SMC family ATPase, partial [Clostridia bacterium]|nr:SMC family ATPase [Clostridia bacterium]
MKPVYLSFSGINSFSERVDIDFERLLAGGLFGIFGNTGSGKSTIVDCIMYALFGRSLRNKTIKECVNNRVNNAFIDFTFEISSDGERKKYNVRRTIKIRQSGFETTARLSEIKCGAVYPIEEKGVNERVRDIVGIGYDEFSKCIILPQNEFSAFVSAERARRLEIIEKLFSLSKYDEVAER